MPPTSTKEALSVHHGTGELSHAHFALAARISECLLPGVCSGYLTRRMGLHGGNLTERTQLRSRFLLPHEAAVPGMLCNECSSTGTDFHAAFTQAEN